MSQDTSAQSGRQDSSSEGIWQQVRLLSDAEFKRLEHLWNHHAAVLQAVFTSANADIVRLVDRELTSYRWWTSSYGWMPNCPLASSPRFWAMARDPKRGEQVWDEIKTIWGPDALRGVWPAVLTLYPHRGLMRRLPLRTLGPVGHEYCAIGYAPHLSRWLVEVRCLVGDLVRVAERRREMARQAAPDEGGTPVVDPFAGLREFARNQLKGQERAVIEALCSAGGEMPIADLAVKGGIDWDNEVEGFRNAQKRLNPKLKKIGWTMVRHDNAANLKQIRG